VFLAVSPGEAVSIGLALAAGVLDYRLQPVGDGERREAALLGMVTRGEVQKTARAMREALKLSNDELDEVAGVIEPLAVLLGGAFPAVAPIKRFLARPTASGTRRLLRGLAGVG